MKKAIVFCLLASVSYLGQSQVKAKADSKLDTSKLTNSKPDSSLKSDSSAKPLNIDEIRKLFIDELGKINSSKDSSIKVGVLYMNTGHIPVAYFRDTFLCYKNELYPDKRYFKIRYRRFPLFKRREKLKIKNPNPI